MKTVLAPLLLLVYCHLAFTYQNEPLKYNLKNAGNTTYLDDASWNDYFGSTYNDTITAMVADETGTIYIAGSFGSNLVFHDKIAAVSSGGRDAYLVVVKDNSIDHASTFGGTGDDTVNGIAVTLDGFVTLAGSYSGSMTVNSNDYTTPSGTDSDIFVMKTTTFGIVSWVVTLGGPSDDVANDIVLTDNGYVVVGYSTYGSSEDDYATAVAVSDDLLCICGVYKGDLPMPDETLGAFSAGSGFIFQFSTNGSYLQTTSQLNDSPFYFLDVAASGSFCTMVGYTDKDAQLRGIVQQTNFTFGFANQIAASSEPSVVYSITMYDEETAFVTDKKAISLFGVDVLDVETYGKLDMFVAKVGMDPFDNQYYGEFLDAQNFGTSSDEEAFEVLVADGTIVVAGTFKKNFLSATSQGQNDVIVFGLGPADQKKDYKTIIIATVVPSVVLIAAGVGIAIFIRMKRKKQSQPDSEMLELPMDTKTSMDTNAPETPITDYADSEELTNRARNSTIHSGIDDKWKIDYPSITVERELGRGAFGIVFLAKWRNTPCVVKQLGDRATADSFFKEVTNVLSLRPHPNICQVLGVCTNPNYPLCIVMEYIQYGNLWSLIWEKNIVMSPELLDDFALDVANGMLHLHNENVIHCDLACRNLLVAPKHSGYTIKITDFGLSRVTAADIYNASQTSVFPVRWTAPEVLTGRQISKAMDTWSYGITLWEMASGIQPYAGMSNIEVLQAVRDGYRLDKPNLMSESMYKLVQECWNTNPKDRPTFENICQRLTQKPTTEETMIITETKTEYTRISRDYESAPRQHDSS